MLGEIKHLLAQVHGAGIQFAHDVHALQVCDPRTPKNRAGLVDQGENQVQARCKNALELAQAFDDHNLGLGDDLETKGRADEDDGDKSGYDIEHGFFLVAR